jgi:hypothetical protein
MRSRQYHLLALVLCLGGCGTSSSNLPGEAENKAAVFSGDTEGDAASNSQCRSFTPQEVAAFSGKPVEAGRNAAGGTGCQWVARDGNGSAMFQVLTADYHSPPSAAPGFKELGNLGEKGFVVPETGGWAAGAIQGQSSINVSTPVGASEESTVAFLREAMKRMAK